MLIDITDTVQLTHTAAEVDADIDGSVRGDIAQTKDDDWKAQARENIGAGSGSGGGRNLLDNGWFTVNQRGQSSYNANGYCVDRWKIYGATLTISDNGVVLNSGNLYQTLEPALLARLEGKTVTLSAIINDTVYSFSFVRKNGTRQMLQINSSTDIEFSADNNVYVVTSTPITIKAVKLELGSVSTLANDSAPDYATELLKCQWYFQVYKIAGKNDVMDFAFAWSATVAYLSMQTPVVFRTTPTASFKNTRLSNANNNNYPITSISVNTANSNAITLVLNTSGLTPGAMYLVRSDGTAQATIELSADL